LIAVFAGARRTRGVSHGDRSNGLRLPRHFADRHDPVPQGSVDWNSPTGCISVPGGADRPRPPDLRNLEVDLYGGFRRALGRGRAWTSICVLHFPRAGGHQLDYIEFYTGLTFRWRRPGSLLTEVWGSAAAKCSEVGLASISPAMLRIRSRSNFSLIAHTGYSFGITGTSSRTAASTRLSRLGRGLGYTHRTLRLALRWIDGATSRNPTRRSQYSQHPGPRRDSRSPQAFRGAAASE